MLDTITEVDAALKHLDNPANSNLSRRNRLFVAAFRATDTPDEAPLFQRNNKLFQIFYGNPLVFGNLSYLYGALPIMTGQVQHQSRAIPTSR